MREGLAQDAQDAGGCPVGGRAHDERPEGAGQGEARLCAEDVDEACAVVACAENVDLNARVEASRPRQGRIEHFRMVSRADDEGWCAVVEPVEFGQQGVDDLGLRGSGRVARAEGVDLVDEDDGVVARGRREELLNARNRVAAACGRRQVGTVDGDEAAVEFGGQRLGERRLPGAGRAIEEDVVGFQELVRTALSVGKNALCLLPGNVHADQVGEVGVGRADGEPVGLFERGQDDVAKIRQMEGDRLSATGEAGREGEALGLPKPRGGAVGEGHGVAWRCRAAAVERRERVDVDCDAANGWNRLAGVVLSQQRLFKGTEERRGNKWREPLRGIEVRPCLQKEIPQVVLICVDFARKGILEVRERLVDGLCDDLGGRSRRVLCEQESRIDFGENVAQDAFLGGVREGSGCDKAFDEFLAGNRAAVLVTEPGEGPCLKVVRSAVCGQDYDVLRERDGAMRELVRKLPVRQKRADVGDRLWVCLVKVFKNENPLRKILAALGQLSRTSTVLPVAVAAAEVDRQLFGGIATHVERRRGRDAEFVSQRVAERRSQQGLARPGRADQRE